jgi:hypothetical protein
MKSVWIILGSLFALIGGSNAQNLVPNGSFEQYEQCPPYPGQIHLANAWDAPNNQTTDFFHRCAPASTGASVPANLVGTQAPKSGDGYAGLRTWVPVIDGNPPYREYLTVALKAPLQAGQAYELQCWASAAEASSHFSDGFGFLFSEAPLPPQAIYTSSPGLRFPSGALMEQTKEWEPYAAVYLARGGERYLTLGNFRADTAMMRQQANTQPPTVYYYIDDVKLEACALPDQLLSERDTFVCQGERLDALSKAPVKARGVAEQLDLQPLQQREDHFGLAFEGYVKVPEDGVYTIYTVSDDGSRLYLGGRLLVDNDGSHSSRQRSGLAVLEKGYHPIKIEYFEDYSGEQLIVKWKRQDGAVEVLGKGDFYH